MAKHHYIGGEKSGVNRCELAIILITEFTPFFLNQSDFFPRKAPCATQINQTFWL
jgi:hypothetical protein